MVSLGGSQLAILAIRTPEESTLTTKRKGVAVFAVVAAGALGLSACGNDGGNEPGANRSENPSGQKGPEPGSVITAAIDEDYTAYNDLTATGNGTWNGYIHNGTKLNFWSYDPEGGFIREKEFGTFEKTSDDPLTIVYTYNDDTSWSDGEPIDCDDLLLEWAALSGKMVGPDGKNIFNAASTNGVELVKKPTCKPGDKQVTVVYNEPYIDWELTFQGGTVPAHIAAQQAGLTPEQLVKAIEDDDIQALMPVAKFWNTGWQFNPGELPDQSLIPSSGPYLIDSWDAGQSITLKANPNFYGTPPKTEKIVLRILDAGQQIQALENGEVDIINPANPSPDTLATLESIGDQVTVQSGSSLTWSHVDMQQSPGRVFDKLPVRQAFAKCIPRQLIVDNLVKPANPDAVVQDLREFFPSDDDYDNARAEAFPEDEYGKQDLDGARRLLQQAGVKTPLRVRLMHGDDPVRNDLAELIKSECDKVGFDIVGFAPPNWGERLSADKGSYDAVMFAWASSGILSAAQSIYQTKGDQNFYGYSNERVDKLWNDIVRSIDRDKARAMMIDMEAELWKDVFNIPLYTNANINAFSSDIKGVKLNLAQNGVTFNMDEWSRG
jgi:peptide/nickel transport system substrate-binding protein